MAEVIGYRLPELIGRARALSEVRPRSLLGITGPPGAGKSTLAEMLADALRGVAAVVAMDGFHLADAELARLGRGERKGAPDTFDRPGFAATLRRLRAHEEETVYLPRFHRDLEAAVAGEIAIEASVPLLIVEGNYLLHWPEARAALDEVWYLDPPQDARIELLVARHVEFGRSPAAAAEWVRRSDEANAALIRAERDRADVVLIADGDWPPPI